MPHAGWRFGRVEAIRMFEAAGEYPPRRSRAPARDPAAGGPTPAPIQAWHSPLRTQPSVFLSAIRSIFYPLELTSLLHSKSWLYCIAVLLRVTSFMMISPYWSIALLLHTYTIGAIRKG